MLRAKVDRLIQEYFPWGEKGFLASPAPAEADRRLSLVRGWLEEQAREFSNAALVLIAKVKPILREIEEEVPPDRPRLLARIDSSSLVKSPDGILEKMVRDWRPEELRPPQIGFRSFRQELTDLGRFRIVANFLSDVERIARALEAPYGPSSTLLTPALMALRVEYHLRKNNLEDSIRLLPEERKRGERCRKGIFYPREPSLEHLKVEVQIQTQLQEAWDKKDHFLVYERKRRGEEIDRDHEIEMASMSEVLYIADRTFDRLRQAIDGDGH